MPLNTVAIKRDDFEKLSFAAKSYVVAKNAEVENVQLKYEYGRFYDSVADEVEIASENERLKAENINIGNQVHTLAADVMMLKQENFNLKADNEKLEKELVHTAEELTKTQSLLKVLQEKFDKVMEFINVHNLKESTVYNYKSQYENHLAPKIGNMKLKDITTPKITELIESCYSKENLCCNAEHSYSCR